MITRTLITLLVTALTLVFFFGASRWTRLQCSEAEGRCTYTQGVLFVMERSTSTKPIADIVGADYNIGFKRGGVGGRVIVELRGGARWNVAYSDEATARDRVATLKAHLKRGTLPTFDDPNRTSLSLLFPAFLCGLMIFAAYAGMTERMRRQGGRSEPPARGSVK